MEIAQLVDFDELLHEENGKIFFKKLPFNGIMYKEIEEKPLFEDCLIELVCVKNGEKIGKFLPPLFPKELFDMSNLQYMWIDTNENGVYIFPDDFNHQEFSGLLFQGRTATIPTPNEPKGLDRTSEEYDKFLDFSNDDYKIKKDINFPMKLSDLTWSYGIFYAVINGKNKIDGKIIYQIDNLGGPSLNCILDGKSLNILKNTDLFDINNHI
ncbi:MAG: hypothetical protein E7D55_15645 [Acinetobacter junii]|nr:hypothetical protein [Acinetobacter junii]